jgi:predicted nucleic acid-binding protein
VASSTSGHVRAPLLLDTSVWIQHVRYGDAVVAFALREHLAVGHVDIAGELRMGVGEVALAISEQVLALPRIASIEAGDAIRLVDERKLAGIGLGWTDASLILACAASSEKVALYTLDRRMAFGARKIGIEVVGPGNR